MRDGFEQPYFISRISAIFLTVERTRSDQRTFVYQREYRSRTIRGGCRAERPLKVGKRTSADQQLPVLRDPACAAFAHGHIQTLQRLGVLADHIRSAQPVSFGEIDHKRSEVGDVF